MTFIHTSDAPKFEMQGNHMTGLASPGRGASEVMAWRAELDPGAASPPHRHDHEEVVVIISGKAKVRIGDEEREMGNGEAFIIPPGTVHQVTNLGEGTFDCVTAMPVGTRFMRPDGEEVPAPPWTR